MYLKLLGWQYIPNSNTSRHIETDDSERPGYYDFGDEARPSRNLPKIMARVMDVDTGEERSVNIHGCLKRQLGPGHRLALRQANKLMRHYLRRDCFLANGWRDWCPVSDLDKPDNLNNPDNLDKPDT